ncbi:arabinan endo-1,5-alpha-L-arabinosidase [Rubellimicrobium rubrum]|uniref:Arabinan endo-1,5-alpha-L-arabinosidase n=1 Tax=Rubellimicrobium rubrum TaxID=2585369 RepID=A0A5C4N3Q3_9RHOB|nr:family 43 glycosylhydrolase [Rubellimicrobium rubrum]TNC50860.1 arabinan endo-1,5-alpha-L-arabinosidase [Rubellimicrobium rubrum]
MPAWIRIALLNGLASVPSISHAQSGEDTYSNPLPVTASGQLVESCADPSVIQTAGVQQGWTMFCTTDPLSSADRDSSGALVFRSLPMFSSDDLVHWTYEGPAFDRDAATASAAPPSWAAPEALFWAPEAEMISGKHYLFFGVTDLADEAGGEPGCSTDGAIGYATSNSPLGPWQAAESPLVGPRRNGEGCDFLWTYDPEVILTPDGRRFIYYGSYVGGIEVRELHVASDGSLSTYAATAVPIALPNRYEGAEVAWHDGAWWLFVSASNCCNGPQTGYAMFVGRAEDPQGPFLDRNGSSFLDGRIGGTPVLVQNGNRWVGPGHGTTIIDASGQWWMLYHAIDEGSPYFEGEVGFTRRPALLDRLDWIDGWPSVEGGPSDEPRAVPAMRERPPTTSPRSQDAVFENGEAVPELSDEFDGGALGDGWTWIRQPEDGNVEIGGGVLGLRTQDLDLYEEFNEASVLTKPMPGGGFTVEARVSLDVPPEGCCQNFVQTGLVLYGDDDNYLKLVVLSAWETRQTEFAREVSPVPDGYPRYGSTVVGPPGDWTDLRLEVRRQGGGERVTAYTRAEGQGWVEGGTWNHALGEAARIGLVSMGGPGFLARFDHVRVFRIAD